MMVDGPLRGSVRELHVSLAWLGFEIGREERVSESLGETTEAALSALQRSEQLEVTGALDRATELAIRRRLDELARLERFEVRGFVRRRDGAPWAGITVEAFDLDLRSVTRLGTSTTDAHGRYTIAYGRDRYIALDAGGPDLVVRVPRDPAVARADVLDPARALAHAGLRFNCPARAIIDLVEDNLATAGATLWDRIGALLRPALGAILPGSLDANDLAFLVEEVGLSYGDASRYATAWRFHDAARESRHEIPAVAWFALLGDTRAESAGELVARVYRRAAPLLRAAMGEDIPVEPEAWTARVTAALTAFATDVWEVRESGPGKLAAIAVRDPAIARAFVERMIGHEGTLPELWRALASDPRLAVHVPAVARVIQLAGLTGYHLPLVAALEIRVQGGSPAEHLPTISDAEWDALIAQHGVPPGVRSAADYATTLRRKVEASYPSRYVAARIDRLPLAHGVDVGEFLRSEAIELHGAPLDKVLADDPELARRTPEGVKVEVARVQRLHRAIGSVDDLEVLMDRRHGNEVIGSAGDVARLGRGEVRRRFGNDNVRADRVFDRALAAHQQAFAIWGKIRPEIDRPLGRALPPIRKGPIKGVSLAPLAIDFCSCERCRSVLSPAAYLTDLLALLDRAKQTDGQNAKYYLYQHGRDPRRNDIGEILLDCPNTTTPLPYIDLVIELLEWHARRQPGQLAPPEHQTTRTARELAISPEHVDDKVYDQLLATAVYPWNLPFSLAHQTARVYLSHLELDRRSLAALFRTQGASLANIGLDLTAADLATLDHTQAAPWKLWGLKESDNDVVVPFSDPEMHASLSWLKVLSYGRYLRLHSGLDQADLLSHLTSRYVARSGAIDLGWPLTECNFDHAEPKLTVEHATALQRHVRLARKLGWSAELVDVVLAVLAPGAIDATTLVAIDAMVVLARRLATSPVEAFALLTALPTWPHERGAPSVYESRFLDATRNPYHQAAFALTPDRVELAATQASIPPELRSVVASAVGITLTELEALVAAKLVGDRLDLAALSEIDRGAKLMRATGLDAGLCIALHALVAEPVLPAASARAVEALLDAVALLQSSRLSVAQAVSLCTGTLPAAGDEPVLVALHAQLAALALQAGWPVATPEVTLATPGSKERLERSLAAQRKALVHALAAQLHVSHAACDTLLAQGAIDDVFILDTEAKVAKVDFAPPGWTEAYARLRAQAIIVSALRLDDGDLSLVLAGPWLDLKALPVVATSGAAAQSVFAQLCTLLRMARLRDRVPVQPSLWRALASLPAAPSPALGELARWSGLPAATLEAACEAQLFQSWQVSIRQPAPLEHVLDLAAAAVRTGVSVAALHEVARVELSLAQARTIRDAARAAQPVEQWEAVARPLQDRLRRAQRDALVAFVGVRRHLSAREMFDEYLIDVEMSDCQLTSRIQQAICSVQLFIQRAVMHLELTEAGVPVEIDADARREWATWLGSYASWVSARSVFLYPETTLDPALRRDKSEQFLALEHKLEQADVTTEIGRDALLQYLEDLDVVAALEPRAIYRVPPPLDENGYEDYTADRPTHVIARTRETPHRHFHRQLLDGRWTAWRKISLDLTEHAVMRMYDGRLFVYWASFTDKASKLDDDNKKATAYEVGLSWSEWKHDRWLPVRTARDKCVLPRGTNHLPRDYGLYALTGFDVSERLPQLGASNHTDPWIVLMHKAPFTDTTTTPFIDVVRLGWFHFLGCNGRVDVGPFDIYAKTETKDPTLFEPVGELEGAQWIQRTTLSLTPTGAVVLDSVAVRHISHVPGFNPYPLYRDAMTVDDGRRAYAVFDAVGDEALTTNPVEADPLASLGDAAPLPVNAAGTYRFVPLSHTHTCAFIQRLNESTDLEHNVRSLLSLGTQQLGPVGPTIEDQATALVAKPYPNEAVELAYDGASSLYNWELFFYAPLLISDRLRANQRFAEAIAWLHLVFDPASHDAAVEPKHAWRFLPFNDYDELRIQELMALLDYKEPAFAAARAAVEAQLAAWRRDPLDPHGVARHRLGAWMRAVTLRYVDTLIAWGDHLFRQETIESLNQATLRYLLAADVLGEKPRDYPARTEIKSLSYEKLRILPLDAFSNALVHIENWVPPTKPTKPGRVPIPAGMTFYFCIPRNDKIDRYWDTVADRLFKVRNCLDITGRARQLLPFDGLFDQLARAKALGDGFAGEPLPAYRFSVMVAKAVELANDVQRLGGELLAALEKRDGEMLSLMRTQHERAIAKSVREIKVRQIAETKLQLEALRRGRDATATRHEFYDSRDFLNAGEAAHLQITASMAPLQSVAGVLEQVSGVLALIPDLSLGSCAFSTVGGKGWGQASEALARALRTHIADMLNQAAMAQTVGSYMRRRDDWALQRDVSRIELEQIDRQIEAAELRVEIAERELSNHEQQMQHADEVADFLTSKFTSAELYSWMVERLGSLYFQAYELAYEVGKRAERTYHFERYDTTSFLQPAYFDKLRQGLLAGQHLLLDLRRMETSYLEHNARDYELTKHVSLVQEFPVEAIDLFSKGKCTITLPEKLFDRDYPSHYLRRIKSLALSLPCVGGAYASVNAKVTVKKSTVRPTPTAALADLDYVLPRTSFVVSTGQHDAGMFEVMLRDDRYLPCEGAGACAEIEIELADAQPDIDPRQITDAILHLRYTAREGATARSVPERHGTLFLSARHDLPDAWQALATTGALSLDLRLDRFPFWATRGGEPVIERVTIAVRGRKPIGILPGGSARISVGTGIGAATPLGELTASGTHWVTAAASTSGSPATWQLVLDPAAMPSSLVTGGALAIEQIEDVIVVIGYKA